MTNIRKKMNEEKRSIGFEVSYLTYVYLMENNRYVYCDSVYLFPFHPLAIKRKGLYLTNCAVHAFKVIYIQYNVFTHFVNLLILVYI